MDFWVWLIIVGIAWALEALATAAKKKKEREQRAPRAAQRPPVKPSGTRPPVKQSPTRQPPPMRRVPPPQVVYVPPPPEPPVEEEQVVFDVPVARAPRTHEPEVVEPLEGVSAEVERAQPPAESTDAQHVRATAKYGANTVAVVTAGPARRRMLIGRGTIRDAILWKEILGRPKGEW